MRFSFARVAGLVCMTAPAAFALSSLMASPCQTINWTATSLGTAVYALGVILIFSIKVDWKE